VATKRQRPSVEPHLKQTLNAMGLHSPEVPRKSNTLGMASGTPPTPRKSNVTLARPSTGQLFAAG
jgi:hypothetical protein